MPSFILRGLDSDFWARVQTKAKAEGATVKAVILRLLTAWLGVLLALAVAGCHDMQPSPVTPPASIVVVQQPIQPGNTATPFAIQISANGGETFTDTPFQTSVTVSGPTDPTNVSVNCNNGSELQAYPGRRGSLIITCAFTAAGSYPIIATALDRSSGFSTSARTDVTVSVRPVPPPPPPPPTPTVPERRLFLDVTCTANVGGSTPCNVSGRMSTGEVVTSQLRNVHWDLGNGDTVVTPGPTITYTYKQPGTYLVISSATVDGLTGEGRFTVVAK